MAKKTVVQMKLAGKRALVRVDFNVPLDDAGNITDDRRIRMALPTLQAALASGARLVLMSHLGRPDGKPDPKYSLKPVRERLAKLMGKVVKFAPDCVGPEAEQLAIGLQEGELLLLENLRFHPGEDIIDKAKKNPDKKLTPEQAAVHDGFAEKLASLGEAYINDAFGTCHRKHVSMYAVPQRIAARGGETAVGLLVEKEIKFLGEAIAAPKRPLVAILGGAKVSDKIKVIEALLSKCDTVLIGGAMAYTFFLAQGRKLGRSLVEPAMVDLARTLLDRAGDRIRLPRDTVLAADMKPGLPTTVSSGDFPDDQSGFDIGPATRELYAATVRNAGTVVWNGPMGVFEIPDFAAGTLAVAHACAEASKSSGAITIIGGGDSAAAIEQAGLADAVTHVSTGGGASLEFLEGKPFAAIDVLDEA